MEIFAYGKQWRRDEEINANELPLDILWKIDYRHSEKKEKQQ